VLRLLLWRMLGIASVVLAFSLISWLLAGGPGQLLRGVGPASRLAPSVSAADGPASRGVAEIRHQADWASGALPLRVLLGVIIASAVLAVSRLRARQERRYVRLQVVPYRTDVNDEHALERMFSALHARLARRWWQRLVGGQPSVCLEVHHRPGDHSGAARSWLGITCPAGMQRSVEAALQVAYPNLVLEACRDRPGPPPCLLRLKKHRSFIERAASASERFEREPEPLMDRLITGMAATAEPAIVQLALTPAPLAFETLARREFRRREARMGRGDRPGKRESSLLDDVELRGGLELQHRPLFFTDIRVIGASLESCRQIAATIRSQRAENRLVERGTALRQSALGGYSRRVQRGEGNPIPDLSRGVFATSELAGLWQLPSVGYTRVPFSRRAVPLAPAPPAIFRPGQGPGTLRDAFGPVSIHVEMRRQNTAVPGTVEQGKSSFLVASLAEDLRRERCAVILLDPKGDAADAALSAVPEERTSTLLDFAHPTCGFNPLAVDAPADVIADYVVAALKNLFTDADWIVGA